MPSITVNQLARLLNVPVEGATADLTLTRIDALVTAGPDTLSFLNADRHLEEFTRTKAGAVLVSAGVKLPPASDPAGPVILRVPDADLAIAVALDHFCPPPARPAPGVHSTAVIAATAVIGADGAIGAHVVIGERAVIGERVTLHPGVVISDDVHIGDDTELFANVVLRERVRVGKRVLLHAGCVIGSDGFGYRWDGKRHVKLVHIGSVLIEDDVEIGSCSCIDRGKFGNTTVGRGTKIDNHVQVGHNVRIGAHAILCGQVGLAGSSVVGNGVVLGAKVGVKDHTRIGDGVQVAALSGINNDIPAKSIVGGIPARPFKIWMRIQAVIQMLPELLADVRKLRKDVEALKGKAGEDSTPPSPLSPPV